MNVNIVIAVHNRKVHTLNCLRLLSEQSYKNFKVILVDDGSSDGTSDEVIRLFPETTLVKGDGNWWWAHSMNEGFNAALDSKADVIITLNNDTHIDEDWLKLLMMRHQHQPNAIIGCLNTIKKTNKYIFFSGIKHIKWSVAKEQKYHQPFTKMDQPLKGLHPTQCLNGRGTLIPCSVFDQIGLYDDKSFPQYATDYDFTLRAVKSGIDILIDWENEVSSVIETTGKGRTFIKQSFGSFIASFFNPHASTSWRMWFNYYRRHAGLAGLIGFPMQLLKLMYAHYRKRNILEDLS